MSALKVIGIIAAVLVSLAIVAGIAAAAYSFGRRNGPGGGGDTGQFGYGGIPPGMPPGIPPARPGMFGAGLPLAPNYQGPPMFAPPYYGPRLPLAERRYESGDSELTMFDIPNRARGLRGCGGCNPEYSPVCGEDGPTYHNSCCADNADVDIEHAGRCKKGAEVVT